VKGVKMVGMTHPRTHQNGTAHGRDDGLWEFPDGIVVDNDGRQINQTPVEGGLIGRAGVEPCGFITRAGAGDGIGWTWLIVSLLVYLVARAIQQ
jgi:hypothetical protein